MSLLAARCLFASARLTRARKLRESLVAQSPDDSYARLLLARTLQRAGLPAEAEPHLRLAATRTPAYR
ncbi:hypothetical protein GCM10022221_61940 [Actinocorallia aurea]